MPAVLYEPLSWKSDGYLDPWQTNGVKAPRIVIIEEPQFRHDGFRLKISSWRMLDRFPVNPPVGHLLERTIAGLDIHRIAVASSIEQSRNYGRSYGTAPFDDQTSINLPPFSGAAV